MEDQKAPPQVIEETADSFVLEDDVLVAEELLVDVPSSSRVYVLGIFLVLVAAAAAAAYFYYQQNKKKSDKKKDDDDVDQVLSTNSVSLQDIQYLASTLHPKSTHLEVLLAVASTPETILYGLKGYKIREKLRKERIEADLKEAQEQASQQHKTKATLGNNFDLDDDGWADDDDDDEKAKLAAKADEEKQKTREQLAKAAGKVKIKLEGIDQGVIGQKWVETTLADNGAWPPKDMFFLTDKKFDFNGKKVAALDHPGLRRNLCMIFGRLNSVVLNGHPELLEAGSKQLIDQTYFKSSMEFRGRCALLMEAALRTAVACRNYELTKTIVETVGLFKIGTPSTDKVDWFNGIMQKQYQTLPRLQIADTYLECPAEEDLAVGDILTVGLELTRLHAEAFTKQKIAMFQKQGIPPQVALQTYREGWWFLVHAERLDGDTPASCLELKTDGLLKQVDKADVAKFEEASFSERLLTAWPMVVQNVAQKSGKVKIQFLAPPVPGRYRFTVTVKSQDFLGADQEFTKVGTIFERSAVSRKPKKETQEEEESEEMENLQAKKEN